MSPQDEFSMPTRAQQVWSHFSGLFGVDALKRKFGPTPPAEWEEALSWLTDAQLRCGMMRMVDSGSEHVPTLPAFLAACRSAREFAASDTPAISAPAMDKWALAANRHLLGHMMREVLKHRAFTQAQSKILQQFKNAWAEDMRVDDKGEGLPIAQQRAAWDDCMERADAQIEELRAKERKEAA